MTKKNISKELLKVLRKVCGNKKRPLHEPFFFGNEKKNLTECIDSTFVSTKSNITHQFEKKISKYTGSKNVIATINGTSALHISLIAIGLQRNEEVFIPSFNFVAAANAISYCGALPNFLDIEESTLSIDPIKMKNYLDLNFLIKKNRCFNKKTKRFVRAVIVPHLFGHPAKIDNLINIAKKYKLIIIEDAAESLGSFYKNKHTGTFGDLGVLSFNGNKTITTGGGGAVLSNNIKLAKRIRNLIEVSKIKHDWKFDYSKVGYNMKMPGLNAALGLAQILNLENIIKMKRKIYTNYKKQFQNNNYFDLVSEPINSRSNYWLQNVKIKKKDINLRDYLIRYTNIKGFQTRPAWTLLHKLRHFQKCPKSDLSTSLNLFSRIISLPSSPNIIKK